MEGGPNIQEANSIESGESVVEETTTTGFFYHLCHPNGKMHRFVALLFMCFLGFGSYFCYDNPAALEDHIKADLNITTTQYALLYSMYSWPNVVLCFVGGFLIDRVFGIQLGTNIYMCLTLIGQVVFASGVTWNSFWIMIMGRFIFGIGAESLAVAQNNYAVLWFKGKELNMVFGLQLSFARVGSTVNFLVMESIYEWVTEKYKGYEGLGLALYIATTTCIFSMLCAVVLGMMDKRSARILRRHETASSEIVKLTDIKDFKVTFWMISVICVSYYIAIFVFIGLGKEFFTQIFKMTKKEANAIDSSVYLISGVASPFLGFLIDKTGKNVSWIMMAVSLTIGAHSLLAFSPLNPYFGMVLMGLSYSCLASSLWPLVSLIIPEYQLGTAYGVCQAVQNLGLAIFTIVGGNIAEKYGYIWLEVFFISSLAIALTTTVILWLTDMYRGGILNMTPGNRRLYSQNNNDDKERLLPSEASSSSDAVDAGEGLQPNTDFQIRNRYLSRIGAPLPDHYCVQSKGLAFTALR